MKLKLNHSKTIKTALFIAFLSLSYSSFALNSIEVDFSTYSNAVKKNVYGNSNGVDTHKTFEITIPFYSSTLNELNLRTDYSSVYCPGATMINVNSNNSTYSNNTNTSLHKWYKIQNLPVGTHYYTVKSLCNGSEISGSRQLIRVIILKEATPTLNLTLGAKCKKDKKGKYNGYIGLTIHGSYTNASKLYLQTTPNTNNCNQNGLVKLTNLANSTSPNNTIANNSFYSCNTNTTYTVKLFYKSTSLSGNTIVHQITSGNYGWTDYTFTKTFKTCMNKLLLPMQLSKPALVGDSPVHFNNPVKDDLKLVIQSDNTLDYEIEIYDFSGQRVKNARINQAQNKSAHTVDVQDLKQGIYIVAIKNGESVVRKKMVKE
ncbi:T9SS type A sorting domain-containing protein [Bizionia paragorgiae]|uniref:Por secretion system C-terminal sorting domain-containing protein n=1 Tax=Bizionia paragorgiae TaxID=283786 RepID=A0A1H4C5S0_BIZPA|nr:T9SS type A sorting domain-containing protein [Bizionia paragorgiae]SEA55687.1 Por secretion system C-terminal sorting domain-containing protein [Bizionia paragorgiae]